MSSLYYIHSDIISMSKSSTHIVKDMFPRNPCRKVATFLKKADVIITNKRSFYAPSFNS